MEISINLKKPNANELNWNSGNLGVVKYLVEHGADIEAQNNVGSTAIMISSYHGNEKYDIFNKKIYKWTNKNELI